MEALLARATGLMDMIQTLIDKYEFEPSEANAHELYDGIKRVKTTLEEFNTSFPMHRDFLENKIAEIDNIIPQAYTLLSPEHKAEVDREQRPIEEAALVVNSNAASTTAESNSSSTASPWGSPAASPRASVVEETAFLSENTDGSNTLSRRSTMNSAAIDKALQNIEEEEKRKMEESGVDSNRTDNVLGRPLSGVSTNTVSEEMAKLTQEVENKKSKTIVPVNLLASFNTTARRTLKKENSERLDFGQVRSRQGQPATAAATTIVQSIPTGKSALNTNIRASAGGGQMTARQILERRAKIDKIDKILGGKFKPYIEDINSEEIANIIVNNLDTSVNKYINSIKNYYKGAVGGLTAVVNISDAIIDFINNNPSSNDVNTVNLVNEINSITMLIRNNTQREDPIISKILSSLNQSGGGRRHTRRKSKRVQ